MNFKSIFDNLKWKLIIPFIFISAIIATGGYYYYRSQQSAIENEKLRYLAETTKFKVDQIVKWKKERENDALGIMQNKFIQPFLKDFLTSRNSNIPNEEIKKLLATLNTTYHYSNIYLFDKLGKLKVSLNPEFSFANTDTSICIKSVIESKIIIINEMHREDEKRMGIDFCIPLLEKSSSGNSLFGIIMLEVNPNDALFSLFKGWPYSDKFTETILVRKDYNDVIYINELLYEKDKPNFSLPISNDDLVASKVVNGKTGFLEGIDYRKIPVVAYAQYILETNWYLITKIDKDIFYKEIDSLKFHLQLLTILIILSIAIGFVLLSRHQKSQFYKELYQSEIEKEKALQQLSNLTKFANDIIILTDETGKIIGVNDKAVASYGYTNEEFMKLNMNEIIPQENRKKISKKFTQIREADGLIFETVHLRKDGSKFPIEISSKELDVQGQKYFQSIIRDITERKNFEQKILENEEKLKVIIQTAPLAIINSNSKAEIITWNKTARDLFGYEEDEIIYHSILDLLPIEMREPQQKKMEEIIQSKKTGTLEIASKGTAKKKDGTPFPMECSLSSWSVKDEIYFCCIINDITEKLKAETEIKESEERFKKAFNSSPIGIVITSLSDSKIKDINEFFLKMTEFPKDEVIGKTSIDINFWYDIKDREQIIKILLEKNFAHNVEAKFRTKTGKIRVGLFSVEVIEIKNEKCLLTIIQDITDEKEYQREIINAKEKAEQLSRLKSNFLANMSHELRTPLIGIIGFADMLHEQIDDEELKMDAEIIKDSGNRLKDTLNLILDLSRIESEKVEIEIEAVDVNEIINETVKIFSASAANKNLLLEKIECKETLLINCDKKMLSSVLNNLINNAVKYTLIGSVRVSSGKEIINNDKFVVIKVADTGIGISEENKDLIFEEFRQVSEGFSRTYEGTGLGLTITKKFVAMMNGFIKVNSKIGSGTEFCVYFPSVVLDKNTFVEKAKQDSSKMELLKVERLYDFLLVDDDTIANQLIKSYLKNICKLDYAQTPNEALKNVTEKKYDCIFMDINLKANMNGIELVKKIRQLENYSATPIVAFTAYAMIGDKENFLQSGCTHYISKPFTRNGLLEICSEVIKSIS